GGDDDDIYKFDRECEEGCELLIAVYDADTKMPLDHSQITFEDDKGNLQTFESDAEGIVRLDRIVVNHDYSFKATRAGYNDNTVTYLAEECDLETPRLEIPLQRPGLDSSDLIARD